jgi:hypothetical protein
LSNLRRWIFQNKRLRELQQAEFQDQQIDSGRAENPILIVHEPVEPIAGVVGFRMGKSLLGIGVDRGAAP